MRKKECVNPSRNLVIVKKDYDVGACGNCVIPQILRSPCLSYQATSRLRAAKNSGLEIKDNPEYPIMSDYPLIAVCQGNRGIAISTNNVSQS